MNESMPPPALLQGDPCVVVIFGAGGDFTRRCSSWPARSFMFAMGCIQAMQCNRNIRPMGITTHNPRLQRGLDPTDKGAMVVNYVRNIAHEHGVIAHACGKWSLHGHATTLPGYG